VSALPNRSCRIQIFLLTADKAGNLRYEKFRKVY
jgi:hypothetical protein